MNRYLVVLGLLLVSGCVRSYGPALSSGYVCSHIANDSDRSLCESKMAEAPRRPSFDSGGGGIAAFGIGWFTLVWYALYYSIGVVFARFVYVDAKAREWRAFRIKPFWWGALCVFDAAIGALVYWVLHYSRLARRGLA
jgi:hypothetical protein